MARSASSLSKKFDQGQLSEGIQTQTSSKSSTSIHSVPQMHEVPLSAASILSPPKSEYAIFLQSQSPKIRDSREIVETRKQRLIDSKTKNFVGPQEPSSSASTFARSTSPSKDKSSSKQTNVAGTESCNIKMGDTRVFAGSNL
jgi:hypothetical protein